MNMTGGAVMPLLLGYLISHVGTGAVAATYVVYSALMVVAVHAVARTQRTRAGLMVQTM
jgi:hypothetical protein